MDEKYYQAICLRTGQIVADKVKIARDFKSRSVGLLNRDSLGPDEGLLIKPCNSIHTFFMKFPIDVVYLDRKGKVLKIKHSLAPWRLSNCPFGYMTLELCKNRIIATGIKQGDIIKID
jgi:uncharacterized membrane protein (UPF0127 family)